MILYHGSNIEIEAVNFGKSKPGKDFGVGFYLSADLKQAEEMAAKKSLILGGTPVVTCFEFDEKLALMELKDGYKKFDHYCMGWGEFTGVISSFRKEVKGVV